eukprot:TRINITY_DN17151_c0_g2_i1.p1 TRINITY_DN17151_c0_g2~~TRINITY_DN17151_c0_g2_i1.p1  ORF type:complete len:309 (-),score=25.63 TRINITY_DN17151_c0_g2_i1:562-1389(-)
MASERSEKPAVHALLLACEYEGTAAPLKSMEDAMHFEALLTMCGAHITTLYNAFATLPRFRQAIAEVGSCCKPGDYLLFFYSGHGANVADDSGSESDGVDEAFVLVNEQQQIIRPGQSEECTFLVDDEFSMLVTQNVHPDVVVLLIVDACHSGTIADFHRPEWQGRRAVCIASCNDHQLAADTDQGGILSQTLLVAIEFMNKKNVQDYSVFDLFQLANRNPVFESDDQDFMLTMVPGSAAPQTIAWPLVPPRSYKAPWKSRKSVWQKVRDFACCK